MKTKLFCLPMIRQWIVLCIVFGSGFASADDLTSTFYQGLRQRNLFLIAEDYAVSQLARPNLLPHERAILTVELSRTLLEHGALSSGVERNELWQEARRILEEFSTTSPDNPKSIVVEAQLAMLPATIGGTLAWEAEIASEHPTIGQEAKTLLETSFRTIDDVLKKVKSLDKPSARELADGALDRRGQQHLEHQLIIRRALAQTQLARLLETNANQAALLIEADDALKSLLRKRLDPDSEFDVKILRSQIYRLRGDLHQAGAVLRTVDLEGLGQEANDRHLAESLRVFNENGEHDEARQLIADRTQQRHPLSDELRVAIVESLLDVRESSGAQGNTDLQTQLLEQARFHHERTRGKWRQLTHAALRDIQQDMELGAELSELVRSAQTSYFQGDLDEASRKYRDAAVLAKQQGLNDQAVDFGLTLGSIQIDQKQWEPAEQTFSEIERAFPNHSKAATAALMACYAMGRHYSSDPSQERRLRYEEMLQSVQTKYAGTQTAADAAWMLGVHQEQRLQWTEAVQHYRKIEPTDSRFDIASLRIILLYERILNRLKELDGDVSDWEQQLLEEIVRIDEGFPQQREFDSLDQTRTALKISQLLLEHQDRWYNVADIWLARIDETITQRRLRQDRSTQDDNSDQQWNQIARAASQLRIVSLAGQQRLSAARDLMFQLGDTSPTAMLSILLGLTELTAMVEPSRQVELGRLQLQAVERLSDSRDELSSSQQDLLDNAHAEAMVATGNGPEAVDLYESLIAKQPRSGRLMLKVIDVLTSMGSEENLRKAKAWWTRYEKLQKPGSTEWVTARLAIARLSDQLGERESAKKLLGVTRTLYPDLGSESLKAEIEKLLEMWAN
ncbi:tetratricopeptide repeat protein [Thalassoglobus neptunius]|uniref:tetratricopeptide repeat protein n=1 Tax=Thalassoglobus neptunius TaxID=1938619 RepID=UPI001E54AAC8|nr:hypothetical protein [Thalassoglobus neptunius]